MTLDPHKVYQILMEYLDWCRQIYRQDFDELRKRLLLDRTNEAQRAIMNELEQIHINRDNHEKVIVPPELLRIYSFA